MRTGFSMCWIALAAAHARSYAARISLPHLVSTALASPRADTDSSSSLLKGIGTVSHSDSRIRSLSATSCESPSSLSLNLATINRMLRLRELNTAEWLSCLSIEQLACRSRNSNTCEAVTVKSYLRFNVESAIPLGVEGILPRSSVSGPYHCAKSAIFTPIDSSLSRSTARCTTPTMSLFRNSAVSATLRNAASPSHTTRDVDPVLRSI